MGKERKRHGKERKSRNAMNRKEGKEGEKRAKYGKRNFYMIDIGKEKHWNGREMEEWSDKK